MVVTAVFALGSSAQVILPGNRIPNIPTSQPLVRYLQLTGAQVDAVARLNAELMRFQLEKQLRAGQVQLELAQEVRKETLDAMAIGLRQVELEAIRREIEAKANETVRRIQAELTADQRARLTALQDVLRNYGMACEAVAHRFLPPNGQPNIGGFLIGGSRAAGCGMPMLTITPGFVPTSAEP